MIAYIRFEKSSGEKEVKPTSRRLKSFLVNSNFFSKRLNPYRVTRSIGKFEDKWSKKRNTSNLFKFSNFFLLKLCSYYRILITPHDLIPLILIQNAINCYFNDFNNFSSYLIVYPRDSNDDEHHKNDVLYFKHMYKKVLDDIFDKLYFSKRRYVVNN